MSMPAIPNTTTEPDGPTGAQAGAQGAESAHHMLYWLARPGIRGSLAAADADITCGRTVGEDQIRVESGCAVPPGAATPPAGCQVRFTREALAYLRAVEPIKAAVVTGFTFGALARDPLIGYPCETRWRAPAALIVAGVGCCIAPTPTRSSRTPPASSAPRGHQLLAVTRNKWGCSRGALGGAADRGCCGRFR